MEIQVDVLPLVLSAVVLLVLRHPEVLSDLLTHDSLPVLDAHFLLPLPNDRNTHTPPRVPPMPHIETARRRDASEPSAVAGIFPHLVGARHCGLHLMLCREGYNAYSSSQSLPLRNQPRFDLITAINRTVANVIGCCPPFCGVAHADLHHLFRALILYPRIRQVDRVPTTGQRGSAAAVVFSQLCETRSSRHFFSQREIS